MPAPTDRQGDVFAGILSGASTAATGPKTDCIPRLTMDLTGIAAHLDSIRVYSTRTRAKIDEASAQLKAIAADLEAEAAK